MERVAEHKLTLKLGKQYDSVEETNQAEHHENHVSPPCDGSEHDGSDESDGKVHKPAEKR